MSSVVVAGEGIANVLRVIPAGRWRGDQVQDNGGRHVEISAAAFQAVLDLKDLCRGIVGDLLDQMRCEFQRRHPRAGARISGDVLRLRSALAGRGSSTCRVVMPPPVLAPLPVMGSAHLRPAPSASSGRFDGSIWDS